MMLDQSRRPSVYDAKADDVRNDTKNPSTVPKAVTVACQSISDHSLVQLNTWRTH
jgi:hypothetical protein